MEPAVYLAAAIAGAIVVLTPGPAVLALLGVGAAQGRRAGAEFIFGHLLGDLLWSILALLALVGAKVVAPGLFRVLAYGCAAYLLYLGMKAVLARRGPTGAVAEPVAHPFRRGVLFGVTNPKSYPVTLSVLAAVLAQDLAQLTPGTAPGLLGAMFGGFLAADMILIWLVGSRPVRLAYQKAELWIVRGTGVMFIGFAVSTAFYA
jgi:threonine/homoserine/homoserine lactone efflux protein